MAGLDALNQGLYFTASQVAGSQAASSTLKKTKADPPKKKAFSSVLERVQEENMLAQEGLPIELAGMDIEDAVIYLKDAADIAADKLRESQLPENFEEYRRKVSQFMKYIVKTNFRTKTKNRSGRSARRAALDPHTQIVVINQKLDELTRMLLHTHSDTLKMLAKIEEINGLLVDLIAT